MSNKLTANLRLQLINAVSGEAREIEGSLKSVDKTLRGFGKGSGAGVDQLTKKLALLKKQNELYDNYRKAQSRQFAAGAEFNRAKQAVESYAKEMAKLSSPSQAMHQNLLSSRNEVKLAAAAFREETAAARAAKTALENLADAGAGRLKSSQKQIREEIKRTTDELRKAEIEARKNSSGKGTGVATFGRIGGAIAGSGAVYYGAAGAKNSFYNAVNMDEATRFQRAVGSISEEKQKPLTAQAFKIGQETKYTNQDVVEAQTQLIQAGVRDIDTILALTESVKNYSLAMRVTMDQGAETVRSALQSTDKDITDPKTAKQVSDSMVNFMVDMAKRGGMGNEDILQYFKYGGAPGKASGFSDSTLGSVAVQLRRGGLRGEEAGVFMRSASGKLVSPTNKGQAALNTMGLEYSDYAKMPDVLSADNLERKFKRDFGKSLSDEQRASLDDLLQNGTFVDQQTGEEMPVSSDMSVFVDQVSAILSDSFQKNKNGKMAAADANKLAAKLGEFYRLSVESVDVEGLFDAVMRANPTLAQLNALFTERQGGRAAVVRDRYQTFKSDKEGLNNVPSDRAKKIGDEVHGGIYGDWMQVTGSIETLFTKIGQDWESTISPVLKAVSNTIDSFANAPSEVRKFVTAVAAATIALGGLTAVQSIKSILGGLAGGGAAGAAGAAGASGGRGLLRTLTGAAGRGVAALTSSEAIVGIAGYLGLLKLLQTAFPGDKVRGRPGEYGQPAYPRRTYSNGSGDVRPMPGVQGNQLVRESKAAADEAQKALNFTATPQVDLSSINALISRAREAAGALRALGGGYAPRTSGGQSDARPMPMTQSKPAIMGHRRWGGSVAAGRAYRLGEDGPEEVTFGSNAYVSPTRAMRPVQSSAVRVDADYIRGGRRAPEVLGSAKSQAAAPTQAATNIGGITATFHIASSDPMAAAREIERVLSSLLYRSQDLAIDGRTV